MFHNISPNRKKLKDGGLTKIEKPLVKVLLQKGYRAQDIVHILNQGRKATVNLARISELRDDNSITPASEEELNQYFKIQSSYCPKTLLNPYKDPRLVKAREAMITAVQTFNSPTILFKTELFCVLANIAWTYLLHEKMEQTEEGTSKLSNGNSVTLKGTLNKEICPPIDSAVKENLRKIAEIRDSVEHIYFEDKGEYFGSLFQACCINFEKYMTEWFGENVSLTHELSLVLQFVRLDRNQTIELEKSNLPEGLRAIYENMQNSEHVNHNGFMFNYYFTAEVTSKTNADIHKLISYNDEVGEKENVVIKKVPENYTKLIERQVIEEVNNQGYGLTKSQHQKCWKERWKNVEERNKEAGKYGELVGGYSKQWLWYKETWIPEVIEKLKADKKE